MRDIPPRPMTTVAEQRSGNVHVRDGIDEDQFVLMREERDAQLGMPRLIIPSLQVNILAGAAPPPGSNDVSYLRIPFNRPLGELAQAQDTKQRKV